VIYKLPQFESIPRITLFHFDIADVITSSPTDWHVILYVEANLRAFLTSSNILQAWFTLANANRVLLTLENANGLVTAFLLLTIQSLIGLWQAQTLPVRHTQFLRLLITCILTLWFSHLSRWTVSSQARFFFRRQWSHRATFCGHITALRGRCTPLRMWRRPWINFTQGHQPSGLIKTET